MAAANTYLDIDSTTGLPKRNTAAAVGGSGHESQIPQLDASGRFDSTMMPVGVVPEVVIAVASENLAGGDQVNLWLSGGVLKARKADASAAGAGKKADGFVLAAVTSGANASVYVQGMNTAVSGLTIGADYFLDGATPGGITVTPVSTGGYLNQRVGKATSATNLVFAPQLLAIM